MYVFIGARGAHSLPVFRRCESRNRHYRKQEGSEHNSSIRGCRFLSRQELRLHLRDGTSSEIHGIVERFHFVLGCLGLFLDRAARRGREGGIHVHATLARRLFAVELLHADVAVLAPRGTPRVFHDPGRNTQRQKDNRAGTVPYMRFVREPVQDETRGRDDGF